MYVVAKIRISKEPTRSKQGNNPASVSSVGFIPLPGIDAEIPVFLIGYGNIGEKLAAYHAGDYVRISGNFDGLLFDNSDGESCAAFQLEIESLIGIQDEVSDNPRIYRYAFGEVKVVATSDLPGLKKKDHEHE